MNLKQAKKNELTKEVRKLKLFIKAKCFDCMAGQKKVDCELERCPLYSFRPWAKNTPSNEDY